MLPLWIRSQYQGRSLGTRLIVYWVCQLVFPEEWVCQVRPLSPVLDRLHEMAEGVTTR